MTNEEALTIVSGLRYKPRWRFSAVLTEAGLVITIAPPPQPDVTASQGSAQTVSLQFAQHLETSAFHDRSQLLGVIRDLLLNIERHELDEWFYDGDRQISTPHFLAGFR